MIMNTVKNNAPEFTLNMCIKQLKGFVSICSMLTLQLLKL